MKLPNEDRIFFGGYYLSDDGVTVFGVRPYHVTECGKVGTQHLLHCYFSELSLGDDESGQMQESADMACFFADYFVPPHIGIFDGLTPYALGVVNYDLQRGLTEDQIVELRGFLIHPAFAGKTFEEVEARYPVQLTTVVDINGNETQQPSHWQRNPEI